MNAQLKQVAFNPDVYLIEGLAVRGPCIGVSCHAFGVTPFNESVGFMQSLIGQELVREHPWDVDSARASPLQGPEAAIASLVVSSQRLLQVGWYFDIYTVSAGPHQGLFLAYQS